MLASDPHVSNKVHPLRYSVVCVHGLTTDIPNPAKSSTLRVASVAPKATTNRCDLTVGERNGVPRLTTLRGRLSVCAAGRFIERFDAKFLTEDLEDGHSDRGPCGDH